MRKMRKRLSLVVALIFLFSQCLSGVASAGTTTAAVSTKDLMKTWVGSRLEPGYTGKFTSTGSITKAELSSLLVKAFALPTGTYTKFTDVSSKAWYKTAVGKATLAGIMSAKGKFHPNYTMSRQIGATIIYKAFRQKAPKMSKATSRLTRIDAIKMIDGLTGIRISKSPSSKAKTYKGNVVITAKNVTMRNATIKGNLIIAQGVGIGDVTLDNVKVEKTMIVMGGGENSIKMNNSTINFVYVDKKDGKVRLTTSGATNIGPVDMHSGGKLEEMSTMNPLAGGFTTMKVTGTTMNAPVIIDADMDLVTLEAPKCSVKVMNCKIGSFKVMQTAKYSNVDNQGTITTFTSDAACTVTGNGMMTNANIAAPGVILDKAPTNIKAIDGITVKVEGVDVDPVDVYVPPITPVPTTTPNPTTTPVPSATLTSIAVTTQPDKLIYAIGDALDITGLVVTGTYSNGTTKIVVVSLADITGFNSSIAVPSGMLVITINGKTTNFLIEVVAAATAATNLATAKAAEVAAAAINAATPYADFSAVTAAMALPELTPAEQVAKAAAIAAAIAALQTPAQAAAALVTQNAAALALVPANYVDFTAVTAALALPVATAAQKAAAAAAIAAAIAALVTPAQAVANIATAKAAAALLVPAAYADFTAVTAALALPVATPAQQAAAAAAINAAIAALVTPVQATANLATANAAAAALVPASYANYADVTAALALPVVTPAQQVAAAAAINAAIAALITTAQAVTNLATATAAAALLVPANYIDYAPVTAALALPVLTPAQQVAAAAAINAAIAALVTPAQATATLATATAAAVALVPANYVDFAPVTAALALPVLTPAQQVAAAAAINAAIAALLTPAQATANLATATAAAAAAAVINAVPATAYANYAAVTAALALPVVTPAQQVAAAAAINAAIAALVTPAQATTNLATANAAAAALVAATYVDFAPVTAALALPVLTPANQIAAAAAINAAIAALVTTAQATTNLATAKTAATVLVAANYVDFAAVTAALALPVLTPAQQVAAAAAINAAVAALVTPAQATTNLATVTATAVALVPANYVDFAPVTAALALPVLTPAQQVAAAAAINAAIAGLVTTAQATTNLATATAAAALLVAANYVDYAPVTAALALPVMTAAQQVAAAAAINAAIAALVTPAQAATNLTAATAAAAALVAANYIDFAPVAAALALPVLTPANQVAAAAAINAAIAGLVTPAQAATSLATVKASAALLVAVNYVDFAPVTAALAMAVLTPAQQVAAAAAITAAVAGLVTTVTATANLTAAKAAAALLVAVTYVDFAPVTAALALPVVTPANQVAAATAINAAIAGLVTVVDANLAKAVTSAGLLSAAEYSNYAAILPAITAALALPAVTQANNLAKTTAITAAIATLVVVPNAIAPTIKFIGTRDLINPANTTLPTNQIMFPALNPALNDYVDPGTIAIDDLAGNITARVVVTGPKVNTAVVGLYPQTYTVTDAAGNTASITRSIKVVARLNPLLIPQFTTQLLIPWAMPKSVDPSATPVADYYEIAMRQHNQQILPTKDAAGLATLLPTTTVWGYGSTAVNPNAVFNAPSLTIEAKANVPTKIKWINGLVDANGNYLPHLLPSDQTIEAFPNPATNGVMPMTPSQMNYVGPVPIITHVHGAHVFQESDGYPEAWYMPATTSIPAGYATEGPYYATYKVTAPSGVLWAAKSGSAVFDYPNTQRANTIWYHDHAMGFTRTNVYAGPAGFYMVRGGVDDVVTVAGGAAAVLPGPAPLTAAEFTTKAPIGAIYEIPLALQDRTFNSDGSLFYPGSRTEFDAYAGPYVPTVGSDVAPIWNPEFFGDTIIVNGNTWPTTNVQPKRYRLRFLNGAQARSFILNFTGAVVPMTQIGTDGGFLAAPAPLTNLTIMPGERADVIVDFTNVAVGTSAILTNIGPDMPLQGVPIPLVGANPLTTGKVMQFKVVASDGTPDLTTVASALVLPAIVPLVPSPVLTTPVRLVSLNEISSIVTKLDPLTNTQVSIGPVMALLGTATKNPTTGVVTSTPYGFMGDPLLPLTKVTENIKLNDTETWEIYNNTADAHPIHLHLVDFQVVNRQAYDPVTGLVSGLVIAPPATESGYKDTVMALPGQVTRIKAKFDIAGRYVWHCHILEHEENDMMRPMIVQ